MDNRSRFRQILSRSSQKSGFWHGNARSDSLPGLNAYFGTDGDYALGKKLGDTVCWVMGDSAWNHPDGAPMWDVLGGRARESLSQNGVFAGASLRDIEAFPWPDVKYLDFSGVLKCIDRAIADDMAVLSGMWCPFFHVAADFFGMENYFVCMHENPALVEAVTERVCDFYLRANELLFDLAGDRIDAFFFGNDFGCQLDMLISPGSFDRFVMPYFVKFTEQAKRRGYYVALHSCGSIRRVIPRFIDAGVDILHPIQARAAGMGAEELSKEYNGKIVFMGGLDTQEIMPFGSPRQVKDEVRRLRELFGPNYILSPSHECILPIVPPENVEAMAEAAAEEI